VRHPVDLAQPDRTLPSRAQHPRQPPPTLLGLLLNPQIISESAKIDEQYEGCWSFFDVRGKVRRPLSIEVEHQDVDDTRRITVFARGVARLVAHEIDHLRGTLYKDIILDHSTLVPVESYGGTGASWLYSPGC